jgi:ABC-type antimicrobial peptide transport system permease subunit
MTILAVLISSALLVSMLSIAEGILYNATKRLEESKRDIIISSSGYQIGSGSIHGIVNGHEFVDELKEDSANITEASPLLATDLSELLVLNHTKGDETTIFEGFGIGIIPGLEKRFLDENNKARFANLFDIEFIDWFEEPGDPHYENNYTGDWTYEVLMEEEFRKSKGFEKGDKVKINNHSNLFTIRGSFKTSISLDDLLGGFNVDIAIVMMHLSELQDEEILGLNDKDTISSISIALVDDVNDAEGSRAVANRIKTEHPFYSVSTREDQLESVARQTTLAQIYSTAIGTVSMIIGLLFVTCIMIMAVIERTNEFGMMRAIGISKKTIFTQTLLESLMIVIIGTLIGLIFGYFGSEALGDYISTSLGIQEEFTAFTETLIFRTILLVISIGTLVSLYPAWSASRKNIVDALRYIR